MKFLQMLPNQKLILSRPPRPAPRPITRPLVGRSTPAREKIITRLIIWLLVALAAPALRAIRKPRPQVALLVTLAAVLWYVFLETLAAGYLEKMIGGIAA